jgi:hypothetical protein
MGTAPSSPDPRAVQRRRARRGCLAWLLTALLAPPAALVLLWEWGTTTTVAPIATGDGWVAFVRRVDYAFPADADTSLWLGRDLADRATWHRLAPTDSVRDVRLTWIAPRVLEVRGADPSRTDLVRRVGDVAIEWR